MRLVRLLAVALVSVGASTPLTAQAPPLEGLDAFIEQAMIDWEIPGLALVVVKDDAVVYAQGYGTREIGKDAPVDAHTMFAIGSAGKAFTSTALAMLAEEDRIDWDTPAITYLPWFQLWDPWVTSEITPRDLVSHRSGLPGGRANLLWYGSTFDREEIVRRIRHLEPTASFRSEYQYQNIMLIAAGQIVAAVSGGSWDDFIYERILRPLGMTASVTSIRPLARRENVAAPHATVDGKLQPVPWRLVDNAGPAGSINSNVTDMAEWLRFHLNEGTYRGQRLLSAEMVEELRTPQTIMPPERGGSMNILNQAEAGINFFAYGLGWFLFDYRGRKVMWHGGNIDGMSAVVAMVPEEELGIVALTNRHSTVVREAVMLRVFDTYLGGVDRDWSADLLKITQEQEARGAARREARRSVPVSGTRPTHPLAEYAGRYQQPLLGDATVALRDGELHFEFRPGISGRLVHWHYDTFTVEWADPNIVATFGSLRDARVTFVSDEKGGVVELTTGVFGDFRRRNTEAR